MAANAGPTKLLGRRLPTTEACLGAQGSGEVVVFLLVDTATNQGGQSNVLAVVNSKCESTSSPQVPTRPLVPWIHSVT